MCWYIFFSPLLYKCYIVDSQLPLNNSNLEEFKKKFQFEVGNKFELSRVIKKYTYIKDSMVKRRTELKLFTKRLYKWRYFLNFNCATCWLEADPLSILLRITKRTQIHCHYTNYREIFNECVMTWGYIHWTGI